MDDFKSLRRKQGGEKNQLLLKYLGSGLSLNDTLFGTFYYVFAGWLTRILS